MEGVRVGVIGGRGTMGSWFAGLVSKSGGEVSVSDVSDSDPRVVIESNRFLAAEVDVVVVAVPLGDTVAVLDSISDLLTPQQLLVDLASVKTPLIEPYSKLRCEILSLHPLFSPAMASLSGQAVTVTRIRAGHLALTVLAMLSGAGLRLVELDLAKHDEIVAVTQGAAHLTTMLFGFMAANARCQSDELKAAAPPLCRLYLALLGRLVRRSPKLYACMLTLNPNLPGVIRRAQRALADIAEAVEGCDQARIVDLINEISSAPLVQDGRLVEQSQRALDAIARRTT